MTRQKTTNYFPHDSNARNDEKLVRLRMKQGAAGYGVYFMILERLREETDYMSAKDYNMIAFDLRVDAALVKSVVEDFGLFAFAENGKCFYSESFSRRMGRKDNVSKQRAEAGKAGAEKRWEKTESQICRVQESKPCKNNDNEKFLARFFRKTNQANIEALMMNFGLKPGDKPKLRKMAEEAVAEWNIAEKQHGSYTDWSQHLIATMRIKCQRQKNNIKTNNGEYENTTASDDYQFGGGFGGNDA